MIKYLAIFLLLSNKCLGIETYGQIYNYNGHSYWMSAFDSYVYAGLYYCKAYGHYTVDIQDQNENDAVASVIYEDRTIGIERLGYGTKQFYVQHTYELITYSNWDLTIPRPYKWQSVQMMGKSGKWKLANSWSKGYWICEDDKINPKGLNITNGKIINIPYDSMVSFRGHTYYIYKAHRDFETTRQICHSDNNGYIFIPNDGTENCAIHELVYASSFVGMTNLGHYKYMTEKNYLATYLPWSSLNMISKECVIRSFLNGELSTIDCNETGHIICESDSVTSGAVSVDCSEENKHHYFSQIFYFQNNSFYVFDFISSRDTALTVCAQRNAALYAPTSKLENCAVMENVEFEIGFNYGSVYVKHVLMRGDDIDSNFTHWAVNYPKDPATNGCVYGLFTTGEWVNQPCRDSPFICYRNDDNYNYSNINCSKNFFHPKNETYSQKIEGKVYTLYGKVISYHDSVRMCSRIGRSLIKTTSSYVIQEINKQIKNTRFHMDYRLFWNDTTITWIGDVPQNPVWAPGEPMYNDEGIVCITVAKNGSFIASRCGDKYIAVCVGDDFPSFAASTSGPTTRSIGLGVGIFVAILAILSVVLGIYIYKKKNPSAFDFNVSKSFGSFRKKDFGI